MAGKKKARKKRRCAESRRRKYLDVEVSDTSNMEQRRKDLQVVYEQKLRHLGMIWLTLRFCSLVVTKKQLASEIGLTVWYLHVRC